MPIASPAVPENKHLSVCNLSRNDSLKSERSDKRVSFNNDVDVKHIPRGSKKPPAPPPPVQKKHPDEWSECKPVKRQPSNLTKEELEREAEDLVDLVDGINCLPLPAKKSKDFTSRSLDRSDKRNKPKDNNLTYSNVTNPLIRHLKADINRRERRDSSNYSDSDGERVRRLRYKSTPNLVSENYENSNDRSQLAANKPLNTSIDNLLNRQEPIRKNPPLHKYHSSAENIADYRKPIPNNIANRVSNNFVNTSTDSDSSTAYRIRANRNVLNNKQLNNNISNTHVNRNLTTDREPNSLRKFSNTSSEGQTRNKLPEIRLNNSHDLSIKNKVQPIIQNNFQNNQKNSVEDMYAQVNKHGLRQRLSMDSDYSAKIIISEEKPHNHYEGDDEAYETYQMNSGNFRNDRINNTNSFYDSKFKSDINDPNLNMSTVGVQTIPVKKQMNKDRKPVKAMAPQPPVKNLPADNFRSRRSLDSGSDLPSANLVRQVNHGFGRYDRSPSPPPRKRYNKPAQNHIIPLLSDTSDSEFEYGRRSDPFIKIRKQISATEHLPEDPVGEEYEEKDMSRLENRTHDLNFNPQGMRPLTVKEVDAMSLELDQHRNQNEYTSNKEFSSNYESKYDKPLTTKPEPNNRDVSFAKKDDRINDDKENLSSTLKKEPKKKNTFSFRSKEKNNKDSVKDKKKKRIKIKFFYDPKESKNKDPVEKFTEYNGNNESKPLETSTIDNRKNRSKSQESRSNVRRTYDRPPLNDTNYRDSSKEGSYSRHERTRSPNERTRSPTRNPPSSYEDSYDDRRRTRSVDSLDGRDKYNRTSYYVNENLRNRHESDREHNRKPIYNSDRGRDRRSYPYESDNNDRNQVKTVYISQDDSDPSTRKNNPSNYYGSDTRRNDEFVDSTINRRNTFLERRNAYERTNVRSDTVQNSRHDSYRTDSPNPRDNVRSEPVHTSRRDSYRNDSPNPRDRSSQVSN